MKERFIWPKMYADVKYFIAKICKCIKDKTLNTLPKAALKIITFSSPMELIGLDFLYLDTCAGVLQYVLVTTDQFTRYTQVYHTRNKQVKTVATKLFNDYILRLEPLVKSSWNKAGNLKINYLHTCQSFVM